MKTYPIICFSVFMLGGISWFSVAAQINVPGGRVSSNVTSTNIGIGTVGYPANMLHIQAPGQADTAERLLRTTVDDARSDFLQVINGSSQNSVYAPVIWGHRESVNPDGTSGPGLSFISSCNSVNDLSSNPAVMQFQALAFKNSGNLSGVQGQPGVAIDPNGAVNISRRPLFDWESGNNLEMRMTHNGTLGIGNANPDMTSKLDVGGDVILGSPTPGANRLLLHTRSWLGGDFFALAPSMPGQSNNFDFSNALFIVPGKGIGIGTGNLVGGAKFAVGGKMYAEQIVVKLQANWPDTVFSAAYPLMDIDAMSRYISANKHLPGIPSAKEVHQNGIDIADMQKRQMQKMEEMSLYIIQLHRQNEALQARLDAMQKQLDALQQKPKDH